MAPKRIVKLKLKLPGRKDATQSSQREDPVDSRQVEGRTVTLAAKSNNASNQSHSQGMKKSPGVHIKQEPTSRMPNIPAAATSSIAKTCSTASPASAAREGKNEASLSNKNPHDPDSMDIGNGSNTTTMIDIPMVASRSNHGSDVDANAPYRTASPVNEISDVSKMNDEELCAYLEHFRDEENRLLEKDAQGILTDFYSRQIEKVRRTIKDLEDEVNRRQSDISSAMKASKSLVRSRLSVLNDSEAQQSGESVGRSLRKRKPGNHARPVKRPRISKETRQIKDTVMKGAFSIIKGETLAAFDKDTAKTLPQISDAPIHLRDHLQAIKNAALQNPDVDKDMIDQDLRAFAGILRAVGGGDWIQPWVSPGDGPKRIGDYKWRLTGMSEPLHHHQLPAIGIMLISEKDNEKDNVNKFALKSGLLFDYMGLGKTVEILGCINLNFPAFRNGNRSKHGRTTTLVVVPKSAVLQWESEVQHHCPDLKVGIYKKECEDQPGKALSNDILLVTYDQLLVAAYPKKKKHSGQPRNSFLFKTPFHRVCLDEAHKIKNRDSVTFKVCLRLQARHRWCASGTPTPNGIAELYSYLKFIKHPLVDEFPAFRDKYLGGKKGQFSPKGVENKYEELDRLLEQIMIRRTPGHKFLGGALLELPETHFHATYVPLSTEETVIYEYVEEHIAEYIIKKSGKTPKPKKQPNRPRKKPQGEPSVSSSDEELGFKSLCEAALRLRQLVASPLLLEQVVRGGIWTSEQVRKMKDEAHSRGCAQTPFIDHFETWISEPMTSQTASKKANRLERKRHELNSLCCPGCTTPRQQEPHKSQCGCVWCQECLEHTIDFCERKKRDILCLRCKMPIGTPVPCGLPGEPSSGSEKLDIERPRMRGEDFLRFQPKEDFGTTLFRDLDANPAAEIPLSSKMHAILEQIRVWQTDAPQDKIILFFQFIPTQRLLGRVFQDQGIEFLYFVGEMDYGQREAAKERFRSDPNIKVMASIPQNPVLQCIPSNQHFR